MFSANYYNLLPDEVRVVPYTDDSVLVNSKGEFIDAATQQILTSDSDGFMEVKILGKKQPCHISKLWLLVHCPLFRAESFLMNWNVISTQEGKGLPLTFEESFCSIWQPPPGGTPAPENTEFYVVPGASRTAVSKDGRVLSRAFMNRGGDGGSPVVLKALKGADGYVRASVYSDIDGKGRSVVHRLMGLALLPYGYNVRSLTINHKDGVKDHNVIDNLEWSSYSANNKHAIDALGASRLGVVVEVLDHVDNCLTADLTHSKAAEFLGIEARNLRTYSKDDYHGLIKGRYQVRRKGSSKPWKQINGKESRLLHEAWKKTIADGACFAHILRTRTTVIGKNSADLTNHLKYGFGYAELNARQTEYFVRAPKDYPHYGMIFGKVSELDDILFADYSEDELDEFEKYAFVRAAFRVNLPDGSTRVVGSTKALSELGIIKGFAAKAGKMKHPGSVYSEKGITIVRL